MTRHRVLSLKLAHLDARAKIDKSHHFAQLSLLLKVVQLLLLAQWDLVTFIPRYPGVLESRSCVISLGGRIRDEIQEEVFGQRREILCQAPLDRLGLDVLKFFVIARLSFLVARMLAAS